MQSPLETEKLWAPRRWILERYSLPHRAFDAAVAEGFVRSLKMGSSRQAARLFHVQDTHRYVLALAAGRQPIRVAGRVR